MFDLLMNMVSSSSTSNNKSEKNDGKIRELFTDIGAGYTQEIADYITFVENEVSLL
jgi:hypothetical protein